jgi:hypothetical protein
VPITAADITPDGKGLALLSYTGAYLFQIDGNIPAAAKLKPYSAIFPFPGLEACCFVPEGLLVSSESREIFLFTAAPFHLHPTTQPSPP